LVAVVLVEHGEAAPHWHLQVIREVPVEEADYQASVVQEPPAADLVEAHEEGEAAELGPEGAHRALAVVAELDREEAHRVLGVVHGNQVVQGEVLHMV